MKLSLTIHNKTYSIESDEGYDGSDVYELAEQFKGLLVNAGYHPSNVDSIFNLDYQWFTNEENQDNMQGHIKTNNCCCIDCEKTGCQDCNCCSRAREIEEFQNNMYKSENS